MLTALAAELAHLLQRLFIALSRFAWSAALRAAILRDNKLRFCHKDPGIITTRLCAVKY